MYRTDIADSLSSAIPAAAADAARDTLGGALSIAETLPAVLGAELAAAALLTAGGRSLG